jgi:hypothetical protein
MLIGRHIVTVSVVLKLLIGKTFDSGHYIAKGSDSALKFNEINYNAQCTSCNLGNDVNFLTIYLRNHLVADSNQYKSGNLIEYRQGLVRKYSEEKVKLLEQSHYFKTTKKKPDQLQLNAMYDFYKKKFNTLKKEKCLE